MNREHVLWTPNNLRKTPLFDEIYNSGMQGENRTYLDVQTGDTIPAQTYYNAETAKISLPNGINAELSKFA